MKKKIKKRLTLNKQTVAKLDQQQKKEIKGGFSFLNETCLCNTENKSCSLGVNCCPPPEENIALFYNE